MQRIKQIIFSDVLADGEKMVFTLTEFHEKYEVNETLLIEMLEHGLIEPENLHPENLIIDVNMLHRIQAARRLHRDLQVNMPGIALVLELRDELDQVKRELEIFRKLGSEE